MIDLKNVERPEILRGRLFTALVLTAGDRWGIPANIALGRMSIYKILRLEEIEIPTEGVWMFAWRIDTGEVRFRDPVYPEQAEEIFLGFQSMNMRKFFARPATVAPAPVQV